MKLCCDDDGDSDYVRMLFRMFGNQMKPTNASQIKNSFIPFEMFTQGANTFSFRFVREVEEQQMFLYIIFIVSMPFYCSFPVAFVCARPLYPANARKSQL